MDHVGLLKLIYDENLIGIINRIQLDKNYNIDK